MEDKCTGNSQMSKEKGYRSGAFSRNSGVVAKSTLQCPRDPQLSYSTVHKHTQIPEITLRNSHCSTLTWPVWPKKLLNNDSPRPGRVLAKGFIRNDRPHEIDALSSIDFLPNRDTFIGAAMDALHKIAIRMSPTPNQALAEGT